MTEIADQVRDRLIEVELQRGDLPTPTPRRSQNIGGTQRALNSSPSCSGCSASRAGPRLGHRLRQPRRRVQPADADLLSRSCRHACHPDRRGPAKLACPTRGWSTWRSTPRSGRRWLSRRWAGRAWPDGVLWLHAHTKDDRWSVDDEIRQSWVAMAAERTRCQAEDLVAGAVDVGLVPPQPRRARRRAVGRAAQGREVRLRRQRARRAPGSSPRQCSARWMRKRWLRGSRPSATRTRSGRSACCRCRRRAGRRAAAVVQRRYDVLREFERGSKQFGSQRQASERAAVRIGDREPRPRRGIRRPAAVHLGHRGPRGR